MNIRELINESKIEIGAELCTKDEALSRLIEIQAKNGDVHNKTALRREIEAREMLGNSAVSSRVAIPSVCHNGAKRTSISAVTVSDGVDYDAPDKKRVKLIFMVVGRKGTDEYIEAKSRLMHLLMDSEFTARLCSAKSQKEFMDILTEREKERYCPTIFNPKYDCSKYIIKSEKPKKVKIYDYLDRVKRRFRHI